MSDKNIVFPERGRVCFAAATCVLQQLKSRGTCVICVVAEAPTHKDSPIPIETRWPGPATTFVLKNRLNPRSFAAQSLQLVLENRHTPPQGRCGCVPCESGSQERGIR